MAPKDEINHDQEDVKSHSFSQGNRYLHNAGIHKYPTKAVRELAQPHLDAFNFMLGEGLIKAVEDIEPVEVVPITRFEIEQSKEGQPDIKLWIEKVNVSLPSRGSIDDPLLPSECRVAGLTYDAPFFASLCYQIEGAPPRSMQVGLGRLPIMVMSQNCRLSYAKSPKELVLMGEEENEFGGYFLCNGNERVIRMLIAPRRNYPMAITRKAFRNRGSSYTDKGILMRCCKPDQSSQTVVLHYLQNGNCTFRISIQRQEYFLPVGLLLRAFSDATDRELYTLITGGGNDVDPFIADRVEMILRDSSQWSGYSRMAILAYLGSRFRQMFMVSRNRTDVGIGELLLRRHVFVHLHSSAAKLRLLVLMIRKLYGFVNGTVAADNPDATSNQELYLGGHVYLSLLKENLEMWLSSIRRILLRDMSTGRALPNDPDYMRKTFDAAPDVGQRLKYFLATGNLKSPTRLDMQQVSGWTTVADKLNFLRFLSHFRCVHRGRFFTEMKTTTVRKLRPEAWGFLCPVHTPDGSPCGLLNHLAADCIVSVPEDQQLVDRLPEVLAALGVTPVDVTIRTGKEMLPVILDGNWIGNVLENRAKIVVELLRRLKCNVQNKRSVPKSLEVVLMTKADGNLFPSLILFTSPARMMRPVINLRYNLQELVGSLAQPFLSVACVSEDVKVGITTHKEIKPNSMLSVIANLTPFSDFNQSPRNMYQCQMGKQTMGTPCHALRYRGDNKIYRIQTPQSALVRTNAQDKYEINDYATGTNAIVAVISYTGYDMEDAMILNKGSYERGFAHGSVYKHVTYELNEGRGGRSVRKSSSSKSAAFFDNKLSTILNHEDEDLNNSTNMGNNSSTDVNASVTKSTSASSLGSTGGGLKDEGSSSLSAEQRAASVVEDALDADGLPFIGTLLRRGDPLYCYFDPTTNKHVTVRYKGAEEAYVDEVRILPPAQVTSGASGLDRVSIRFRYNRNPVIGDKFSSRHGQKGVCSQIWPQENMPFSESGMTPDIIINPHAFPSRMTIGMLIESMAGKSAALHGVYQDATPFRFDQEHRPTEYFGEQLLKAGYNFYGNEPMYSGIYGTEFKADIYFGVVFYQRLRHMVKDKYQVRTLGPNNILTRQPVKGRKGGGGIRFGEMERDSLLAHGTSFLLHDRLSSCSDSHKTYACRKCGSILSLSTEPSSDALEKSKVTCRACSSSSHVSVVEMPYVFRYMATELAAMNMKVVLDISKS